MSDKYSDDILEVWAYHEAFLRLGFSPDDIFVSVHTDPRAGQVFGVILRAQGLQFIVNVANASNEKTFFAAWKRFSEDLNGNRLSKDELKQRWEKSKAFGQKVELLMALLDKGFEIRPKKG
jgi:hypothetical protein